MTISMIVFVTLQLYWIKELRVALNQDFSNKVYDALESSAQKAQQAELDKYLNVDYRNFAKNVTDSSNQPTQTYIQQNSDSANKSTLTFQKSIVESQNFPISKKGDTLKLTKLYTDEGILQFKKEPNSSEPLTAQISKDFSDNTFSLREFAKLNGTNLPIERRIDPVLLDSILKKELKLNGLDTKFGFAVMDKKNQPTKIVNSIYTDQKEKSNYTYPLFTDSKDQTLYTLALVFPRKDYTLAKNNLPMLLGTIMSLLTILGIYFLTTICVSCPKLCLHSKNLLNQSFNIILNLSISIDKFRIYIINQNLFGMVIS